MTSVQSRRARSRRTRPRVVRRAWCDEAGPPLRRSGGGQGWARPVALARRPRVGVPHSIERPCGKRRRRRCGDRRGRDRLQGGARRGHVPHRPRIVPGPSAVVDGVVYLPVEEDGSVSCVNALWNRRSLCAGCCVASPRRTRALSDRAALRAGVACQRAAAVRGRSSDQRYRPTRCVLRKRSEARANARTYAQWPTLMPFREHLTVKRTGASPRGAVCRAER
jgi:hypothetical protein